MKSPEFISHGIRDRSEEGSEKSEDIAESILETGFQAREGEATVSGDLIHSYEYAQRGKGDGRIIIMRVPDDRTINYGTHTGVTIDEEQKEIRGYVSKYVSGRRQLGIYGRPDSLARQQELEGIKSQKGEVPRVTIEKEQIVMSIFPSEELGEKLEEIESKIKKIENIDIKIYTNELFEMIAGDERNIVSSQEDMRKIILGLLESTVEAEVIRRIRSLSGEVHRVLGYDIHNRGELLEKRVNAESLRHTLDEIAGKIDSPKFDIGNERLKRYIRMHIHSFINKLNESS